MQSLDKVSLTSAIGKAFESREVPERCLAAPIAGDVLPDDHPGYGKGKPIPENDSDFIYRNICGRTWQDVNPSHLEWSIFYLSVEAICYYLPAILIYNLDGEPKIETIDAYLTNSRSSFTKERSEIAAALSSRERQAIVAYMEFVGTYPSEVIDFWKTTT